MLCVPAKSYPVGHAQYETWQRARAMALGCGTHLRMVESVSPPPCAVRETARHAPGIVDSRVHSDLLDVPTNSTVVVARLAHGPPDTTLTLPITPFLASVPIYR